MRNGTDQRCAADAESKLILQLATYQLIGRNGITGTTRAWSLRERFRCLKCKRRPPKRMWIEKWRD
jgi:hypothetical protein